MRISLKREEVIAFLVRFQIDNCCVDVEDLRDDGFEGSTDREVITDWLKYRYAAAPNQFLAELYEFASNHQIIVEGTPNELFPCKCCGYQTICEPGQYDICRWCGWEDDGTTDPDQHSSVNKGAMTDYRELLEKQNRISAFHRWIKGTSNMDKS